MNIYHYIAFGLFATFAAADFYLRARQFPGVRLWRVMGVTSMLLYFAIATYAPFLWDEWLGSHQLINASGLPFLAQVLVGTVNVQCTKSPLTGTNSNLVVGSGGITTTVMLA